jgi:hypothetical protein
MPNDEEFEAFKALNRRRAVLSELSDGGRGSKLIDYACDVVEATGAGTPTEALERIRAKFAAPAAAVTAPAPALGSATAPAPAPAARPIATPTAAPTAAATGPRIQFEDLSPADQKTLKQTDPDTYQRLRTEWLRKDQRNILDGTVAAEPKAARAASPTTRQALATPTVPQIRFEELSPLEQKRLKASDPAIYDRLRKDWLRKDHRNVLDGTVK